MNEHNTLQQYRERQILSASPAEGVVMLYDGIIRNLQQAKEAMAENKIEERFNKLVRASEIIMGLQMSLDFDQGQDAAQVLYDFYSSLDSRILQLHRGNDEVGCQQLIDDLKEMRTIWDKIDKGEVNEQGQVDYEMKPEEQANAQGVQGVLDEDMAKALLGEDQPTAPETPAAQPAPAEQSSSQPANPAAANPYLSISS